MSRPVTPAPVPISTSTPHTAQSNHQRPLSPTSLAQAPLYGPTPMSRSNSQRALSMSGKQQPNQAPIRSRANSQRQVSNAASVQGQNEAPLLSRSGTQRSGHGGSRPVSYLPGDETNSVVQRENAELSQGGLVNDEDHIPMNDASSGLQRAGSQSSQTGTTRSRSGTLKKKSSLRKSGSIKRSGSKKSSYAGSVRSMRLGEKEKYEPNPEHNSVFFCPVPTTGNPTDLLAERFQAWRRVLKDLINYFREVQKSYEARSKTLTSASNIISNTSAPSNFLKEGGLADAVATLRDFHRIALSEANKSKDLENEVILQLTGLQSDLKQKIKEIKSLSGDFKNSVGKEQESTKKVVRTLQESLGHVDHDAGSTTGKHDPFLVKLGVDRQINKQIEEENYLHRAYLNLEASGRELESIVVGEIQKAYQVLANIMKREADNSYEAHEKLREGPLAMAKDHEWDEFVTHSNQMIDPRIPLRQAGNITYNGKDHPAAIEVKSGMLERKSKYLKNYTPGWYVLSPTHIHEFKSADKIASQSPVMSLYLPEQKLGTHSEPGSNSHKFMLKGRQAGGMHRGHSWIFRAETHDTMIAWYQDIKELTEKRGEERNEFVRRTHARTLSSGSKAASIKSVESGIEDDEADKVPFSTQQSIRGTSIAEGQEGIGEESYIIDDNRSDPGWRPPQRPTPGGRFPSDLNVQRGLAAPLSPSSGDSYDETDRDAIAAAGALPGSGLPFAPNDSMQPHTELQQGYDQRSITPSNYAQQNNVQSNYGQQNNVPSTYGQQSNVPSSYIQQSNVPSAYGQQSNVQTGYGQPSNMPSSYEQTTLPSTYNQSNNMPSTYGQQSNIPAAYGQQKSVQPNFVSQGNDVAGTAGSADYANGTAGIQSYTSGAHPAIAPTPVGAVPVENASNYGEWMAPMTAAAGVGGVALGAGGAQLYQKAHEQDRQPENVVDQQTAIPAAGQSSAPIMAATAAPINAPTRPRAMTDSTQDTATATSYSPSAHTQTTAYTQTTAQSSSTAPTTSTARTSSTAPTNVSFVGVDSPSPAQTLAAAGIDPHFTRTGMPAFDTTSIYAKTATTDQPRPDMPHSAKSVMTISELHVPGEYPRTYGA